MMLSQVSCNICKSNEYKVLIPGSPFRIVKCKRCGLVYKNPRLTEEEALKQVESDGIIPEHRREVWHDSKIKLFERNLKRIEVLQAKGRLLDVGCGYGLFLKLALENGWQVWGVEPSRSAYEHAREEFKLDNIQKTTLRKAGFSENFFDVVTLWDVVALFYDPLAELKETRRILKPEGIVGIRVHNAIFQLFFQRLLRILAVINRKLKLKPSIFHPYTFSPKTIRKILERAGLEIIAIEVSEPTQGDPCLTGGALGAGGVQLIKTAMHYACKAIYYLTFRRLILSSAMLVFARKPSK
ncbi:MAG: class I SAM-dependent methyltransferase [Candidatus Omnitrophica bacterium]|nr:class I SAM-dependent methyltransferase [Candidatus Omnitrophota bacterium]